MPERFAHELVSMVADNRRNAGHGGAEDGAGYKPFRASQPSGGREDLGVNRIAKERLIAAFAYLDDRDPVLLCRAGEMEERHAHRVGNGLVLMVDEFRQAADHILVLEDYLVMICAEYVGDSTSVRKLIEAWLVGKRNREGPERLRTVSTPPLR
jgi:hypothetical protein